MQMRQRIQGEENIPEGFSFKKKKKKGPHQRAVSPLLSECICFPFRKNTWNPVSSLLSFIQPPIVRAGEEAVSQRSDSSAIRRAFGLQRCLFLLILPCSRAAASKAILQLSCWHRTAFHSPHCQIPSAARFSPLSLRKQNGQSPVR